MDFDHLSRAIVSDHGPCGDDLVFSTEFDEIQEARRFDDPSLSQGEWVTNIKEADWASVVRICEGILANKSKDLRVAAWLTEASCKLEGLGGLANGYTLLGRLCETFWNDIHPQSEDGDIEQRVGVLDWLVNQTAHLIRETPLTHSDKGRFSTLDHESARATAKNIERNPGMADELSRTAHVKLETFEAALKDTPQAYFIDGMRNAELLKNSVKSLQTVLDAKMGEFSPAFSQTLEALDDVYRFFQR
jgi:type VI secretion system protein ImpA